MQNDLSFEVYNPDSPNSTLILCDHATNIIPECVNNGSLGIKEKDMQRHIAYDIGAKAVSILLADALNATLVSSCFSRLVIDPNRGKDDPTLLMKIYDGTIISGNRYANRTERERRLGKFHQPYHAQITTQLDKILARGQTPSIISIHSFTSQLRNRPMRPWQIGILWDKDPRLPVPLLETLNKIPGVCIGDNEPYSGDLRADTMYYHATLRNFPHVLIELRNDLIDTEQGQSHWTNILTKPLQEVIENLEEK